MTLNPRGLEAAAKALCDVAWERHTPAEQMYRAEQAEAAVRAYLAALPVPSDAEGAHHADNPYRDIAPEFAYGRAFAWDEGFAAGRAAAHLPDGVLAFVNWFAEGPCGCDGESDDPCDSCRALALLASFDGSAAVHPDPPEPEHVHADDCPACIEAAKNVPAASPDPPEATPRSELRRMAAVDGVCPICHTATHEPPEWERANCSQKHRIRELEAELAAAASPDERLREALRVNALLSEQLEEARRWHLTAVNEKRAAQADAERLFTALDGYIMARITGTDLRDYDDLAERAARAHRALATDVPGNLDRTVLDPETGIEEPVTTGRIPDTEFVEPPTEIHNDPEKTRAYLAGLAAGRSEKLVTTDHPGRPDGTSVPDQTRRIVVYDVRHGRGGLDVPVGCTVGEAALLAAEMFGVRVGPNDRPSFGLHGTGLHPSDPLPDDLDYELFVIGGTV